ncbi:hypothetical protein GCM10009541_49260 [Micromonospora gifhornensis]|uniref:Uncharacterized protein n=1 Tax=Micromonospora gifhornensis TaxID=84594 RepID=A0ABQ4ILQ2_9ACTN|nr:hypothetical protein Vgi01_54390 [Micromonospora gifhornensis]
MDPRCWACDFPLRIRLARGDRFRREPVPAVPVESDLTWVGRLPDMSSSRRDQQGCSHSGALVRLRPMSATLLVHVPANLEAAYNELSPGRCRLYAVDQVSVGFPSIGRPHSAFRLVIHRPIR